MDFGERKGVKLTFSVQFDALIFQLSLNHSMSQFDVAGIV